MTAELVTGPPWPEGTLVVDLDRLGPVTLEDLAGLERRDEASVGVVRGRCEGAALAVAVAVDLLVATPGATFGRAGDWVDVVVRRGTGIVGRKAAAYLTMTGRAVDADLARRWGLVSLVADDPGAAATGLAEEVAARSPVAVATILRQAHRGAAREYTDARLTGPPSPGP
ncbi:MAG: enoyl-CoA hydratase-related protein [Acidimicrobiia bacterium]|nr:enoyl-CoA hydratase-related protein [Acidimicrobiia bacterium]